MYAGQEPKHAVRWSVIVASAGAAPVGGGVFGAESAGAPGSGDGDAGRGDDGDHAGGAVTIGAVAASRPPLLLASPLRVSREHALPAAASSTTTS
ncbi:MAG: hypothetical protein QOI41_6831 [Myxococcales bacterium]|nr:hypothetical protein [Myxococcales bacterium]